jgi:hypothetical protein
MRAIDKNQLCAACIELRRAAFVFGGMGEAVAEDGPPGRADQRQGQRIRRSAGGEAVLLLSMDAAIPEAVLKQLASLPGVKTVKALKF